MSKSQWSREPTFGQLCVIAKEQIQAEPTIDDFEWKHRIKDRLLQLRFEVPSTSSPIQRAMSAVHRALERQWGPRPSTAETQERKTPAVPPTQEDPPWRGRRREAGGFVDLQKLMTELLQNPPPSLT